MANKLTTHKAIVARMLQSVRSEMAQSLDTLPQVKEKLIVRELIGEIRRIAEKYANIAGEASETKGKEE
jgi:hypothetical protein